jgi:hypothetical protein
MTSTTHIRSVALRTAIFSVLSLFAFSAAAQAPRIFVSARFAITFGGLKVGKDTVRTFYILNTDSNRGPIHVQMMGPFTSDFSLLSPRTFQIDPLKLDTIRIRFAPTVAGSLLDSITFAHDADTTRTKNPTTLRLTGDAISAGDTSPSIFVSATILQTNALIDTTKTVRFVIRNVSDTMRYLSGTVVGIKPPFSFISGDSAFLLKTGDSAVYQVRFAPKVAMSYTDTLHIRSNADALHSDLTLVLRGTAADSHPSMSLSIRYVDFGVVTVGKDSLYELTLGNTGNSGILYDTVIGPSSGVFSVVKGQGDSVLQGKQTMKIILKFSPSTAGSYFDSVIVNTNALATDSHNVIALVGVAEPPSSVHEQSGSDLRLVVLPHSVQVLNPSGISGAEVAVFDESGACRLTTDVLLGASTDIDLSSLPHGSFFVELTYGTRSQIRRIVR